MRELGEVITLHKIYYSDKIPSLQPPEINGFIHENVWGEAEAGYGPTSSVGDLGGVGEDPRLPALLSAQPDVSIVWQSETVHLLTTFSYFSYLLFTIYLKLKFLESIKCQNCPNFKQKFQYFTGETKSHVFQKIKLKNSICLLFTIYKVHNMGYSSLWTRPSQHIKEWNCKSILFTSNLIFKTVSNVKYLKGPGNSAFKQQTFHSLPHLMGMVLGIYRQYKHLSRAEK